jgi:hypothetical protein
MEAVIHCAFNYIFIAHFSSFYYYIIFEIKKYLKFSLNDSFFCLSKHIQILLL